MRRFDEDFGGSVSQQASEDLLAAVAVQTPDPMAGIFGP